MTGDLRNALLIHNPNAGNISEPLARDRIFFIDDYKRLAGHARFGQNQLGIPCFGFLQLNGVKNGQRG